VMQALDHLCVLNDILDPEIAFDCNNILLLGFLARRLHRASDSQIRPEYDQRHHRQLLLCHSGGPVSWQPPRISPCNQKSDLGV
jgi:hypothetical protein